MGCFKFRGWTFFRKVNIPEFRFSPNVTAPISIKAPPATARGAVTADAAITIAVPATMRRPPRKTPKDLCPEFSCRTKFLKF